MTVKYVYDVVYDSVTLLEESGHTFPPAVNELYDVLVSEGKIISYSFTVNIDTVSRRNTITYSDMNACQEHTARYKIVNPQDNIVAGRTVVNRYLEDENGNKIYIE
jgi:hypothetical protein